MISKIQFGSTYKISSKNNGFEKLWKVQNFMSKEKINDVQISVNNSKNSPSTTCTIFAQDNFDNQIEAFFANNGIIYKKLPTKALLEPRAITERIAQAPKNKTIAFVNASKLRQLQKNQQSNISHCENDYNVYYKENTNKMLKSGDPITATSMTITSNTSDGVQDLIKYISKYGANNLNKNQISINFNQTTDMPDHCIYFALRDVGMKNIPVYVDSSTYSIGKALEIFK